VDLLQFEIEQQDGGVVTQSVSEVPTIIKIVQGLHAIARDNNLIGKIVLFKGSEGKLDVFGIVLHQ
jgi:hypothetical protein